jgi:hypothetical protein
LNVKRAGAPSHAMRHPCRHRPGDRTGLPILCPILPCDAGSTAHATVRVCSEKDTATLLLQGLQDQGIIGLPGPGCRETIAATLSSTKIQGITARHQHGGSAPTVPHPSHRHERPKSRRQIHLGHRIQDEPGQIVLRPTVLPRRRHRLAWLSIIRHDVRAPGTPPLGVQRTYTSACIRYQWGLCNGLL